MQLITEEVQPVAIPAPARQCVVFQLGREEYGVDIADVQEIIKHASATRIPNSLDFVTGVINLRGSIIPIVDLRLRLGLPATLPGRHTCIVIVSLDGTLIGLTVDRVAEVQDFPEESLEHPPQSLQHNSLEAVDRIGKTANSMVMLLDVRKLFPMDTFTMLPSLR